MGSLVATWNLETPCVFFLSWIHSGGTNMVSVSFWFPKPRPNNQGYGRNTRSPSSALYPFVGEGSPTIDDRKRVFSPLEDLARGLIQSFHLGAPGQAMGNLSHGQNTHPCFSFAGEFFFFFLLFFQVSAAHPASHRLGHGRCPWAQRETRTRRSQFSW